MSTIAANPTIAAGTPRLINPPPIWRNPYVVGPAALFIVLVSVSLIVYFVNKNKKPDISSDSVIAAEVTA